MLVRSSAITSPGAAAFDTSGVFLSVFQIFLPRVFGLGGMLLAEVLLSVSLTVALGVLGLGGVELARELPLSVSVSLTDFVNLVLAALLVFLAFASIELSRNCATPFLTTFWARCAPSAFASMECPTLRWSSPLTKGVAQVP